jgi:hypothetical protein
MFDKSALTATAARDPLVTVFALFVLGGLATYFLFKTRPIGRAIARSVFPTLLTIALLRADIVPYQPLQSTGTPFRPGLPRRPLTLESGRAAHSLAIGVP